MDFPISFEMEYFNLYKGSIGGLIGSGGSTIKHIQSSCECKIIVPSSRDSDVTCCAIIGNPASVQVSYVIIIMISITAYFLKEHVLNHTQRLVKH